MRFKFDRAKSEALRKDPRRGVSFEEGCLLWELPHYIDLREKIPEQWRAIGWVGESLYTVIFEERLDDEGSYLHLVTLWKATRQERTLYEKNT